MANYDFKGPPDNNLTTTEVLLWNMGILLRQILEAGGGNVPVPLDVNVINTPVPVSFSGGEENPTSVTISAVGAGVIDPGAKSLVIITDVNFTGTFMGDSYSGEQTIPLSATPGWKLTDIQYELFTGSFKIIRIE